jgi:hypothetical protein
MDSVADKYRARRNGKKVETEHSEGTVAAKYRQRQSEGATQQKPSEEKTLGPDNSNWVDRVNAIGQGASFGFSDELGSAIGAGAVKTVDFLTGSDADHTWGEIYSDMMDSEAAKRKHYAEQNPYENIALQAAGGLATGGYTAAKTVLPLAAKMGGGKLATTGAAGIVGAAEGGVAGFGSTDGGVEERLSGAGLGATVGAVLPLAVSGLGAGARTLSNRRVAEDVIDPTTGKVKPLTLADKDGWVGDMYRNIVSHSFGGGSLKRQAQPYVDAAERKLKVREKALKRVKNSGKLKVEQAEQTIRDTAEKGASDIDVNFRAEALRAVTPAKLPTASRTLLDPENPQAVVEQLGQFWTKNGFKSAKDKTFDLDIGDFERSLKGMFDDDPNLQTAAGDYLPAILSDFNKAFKRPPKELPRTGVTTVTPPQTTKGTMRGDELMELRNKYARAANATSDDNKREAFRRVASRVDNMITDRLDGKDLSDYKDDMARWEGFTVYGNATGSAANKKGGKLTQDEWLAQTKKSKKKRGGGVLQAEAQAGQAAKGELASALPKQIKNNPVKKDVDTLVESSTNRLAKTKDESKELNKLVGARPNIFRTLAATTLAGGFVPFAKDVGDVILSGTGVATGLSQPRVQQVLAGQTSGQKALADALRKVDDSGLSQYIRSAPSAAFAGREDEFENF